MKIDQISSEKII